MALYTAQRLWRIPINLVGIVVVAIDFTQHSLDGAPPVLAVAAWTAWVLWIGATFIPERFFWIRTVLAFAMIAGGSLSGASADVVGFIPTVSGILILAGSPLVPLLAIGLAMAASAMLIALGAAIHPAPEGAVATEVAVLIISGFGGMSRRQRRDSDTQARALLEERIATEQERAQVAALSERSRIARDLHDVLAHSLGGLVIQLEAVDALLESGQSDQARNRVQAARKLAVAGLADAKQAVSTLRDPSEPLSVIVNGLAETHRSIGGQIAVRGDADRGELSAAGLTAARRAVQEILTNARRHAPGAPTTLDLDWDDDMLTITASTPAGRSGGGSTAGGGHGLAGMRERVDEAGGTMTVRPGSPFEIELRLPGTPA